MRIGLISSLKEQKGLQKAAREGDMSKVQKPVAYHLNTLSKALMFQHDKKLIYTRFDAYNETTKGQFRIISGLCC